MPKLSNWSVVNSNQNPYQAPEQGSPSLRGTVTGHNSVPDGTDVVTSRLIMLDIDNCKGVTCNTTYELSNPSINWLDWVDQNGYSFDNRD